MPWIKVDDHFDEHPKHAAVGPVGWGVWLAGLAYCNRNLTDGFIPWSVAEGMGGTWRVRVLEDDEINRVVQHRIWTIGITSGMQGDDMSGEWVADLLVEYGLWERVEGGFHVHDYESYQPSKADVLEERRKWADKKKSQRESPKESPRESPKESSPRPNRPVPVPVPLESSIEDSSENAREGSDEPEWPVIDWLSKHKASIREGGGLHLRLCRLAEKHGAQKVIQTMAELGDGLEPGQYILGADNVLNPIPSPPRQVRPKGMSNVDDLRRATEVV